MSASNPSGNDQQQEKGIPEICHEAMKICHIKCNHARFYEMVAEYERLCANEGKGSQQTVILNTYSCYEDIRREFQDKPESLNYFETRGRKAFFNEFENLMFEYFCYIHFEKYGKHPRPKIPKFPPDMQGTGFLTSFHTNQHKKTMENRETLNIMRKE